MWTGYAYASVAALRPGRDAFREHRFWQQIKVVQVVAVNQLNHFATLRLNDKLSA